MNTPAPTPDETNGEDSPKKDEPLPARVGEVDVLPALPRGDRRRAVTVAVTKLDLSNASRDLMEAIERNAPMDRIVKRIAYIAENATTTSRGKDGGETEDFRTQLAACLALLAYRAGRPIEQQQITTTNIGTDETEAQLAERIANSPALKAQLKKLLAE